MCLWYTKTVSIITILNTTELPRTPKLEQERARKCLCVMEANLNSCLQTVQHLGPVQQRSKNGNERDMAASMWVKCHPRNLKPHMNWVRALTVENVSGYLSPTLSQLLIRSEVRVSCRTADEAPAKQQHQLVIKFCTLMLGLVSRNHTFSLINVYITFLHDLRVYSLSVCVQQC